MPSKTLSYSGALGLGWDVMKSNFGFFAGILVVSFLISLLGQIVSQIAAFFPMIILPFLMIASFLASLV